MKPKTRFMKMYYKLPEKARKKLVINFTSNPMNLFVVGHEIREDTRLGKKLLFQLGYMDVMDVPLEGDEC